MRKILIEIDGAQYILEGDELILFDNYLLKDLLRMAAEERLTKRAADLPTRCVNCGELTVYGSSCHNALCYFSR